VTDVLVDLKQRIKGEFFIIEETDEKIVLGNHVCPFEEKVVGRPAMCMMTSNVFGSITSGDDRHSVELYDIGPSPHADEMIVVYLPQHKILFQSDLFFMANGGTVTPAQDLTIHFAEQIQKLNLNAAKIAGGHGRVATIEELTSRLKASGDDETINAKLENKAQDDCLDAAKEY
jgi:hypothetical protein